jgi:hypothetical protein
MDAKFQELFKRFYSVQCEKYLQNSGRNSFGTRSEELAVYRAILDGWNTYIETGKEKLLTMKHRDIINFFEAVELGFPRHRSTERSEIDSASDDAFDPDSEEPDDEFEGDEDELPENEMDFLQEELERLSDELDEIPESEREDVIMLMLAFPALQEIGFPIDVFISGDGSTHLTAQQRQQIDWARQLAYKVVAVADEEDENEKNELFADTVHFASAFIKKDRIDSVIREIQTTYERGKNIE